MSEHTPFYGASILEQKIFSVLDIQILTNDLKALEIENRQQKEIIQGLLEVMKEAMAFCFEKAPDNIEFNLELGKKLENAISKAQERKP